MLATPRFVFIHPPKTGGSFVAAVLEDVYGSALREVGSKHGGRSEIPAEHRGKPVLTIVREPVAFYTSTWRFGWWIEREGWMRWDAGVMKARYPHYPYISFREFVEGVMDDLACPRGQDGIPLGLMLLSTLEAACSDLSAALACAERGDTLSLRPMLRGVTFLHTEHLADELATFLVDMGVPDAVARRACRRPPVRPVNTPDGGALRAGHGLPYNAADRSHLDALALIQIKGAEMLFVALFPEYRTPSGPTQPDRWPAPAGPHR